MQTVTSRPGLANLHYLKAQYVTEKIVGPFSLETFTVRLREAKSCGMLRGEPNTHRGLSWTDI